MRNFRKVLSTVAVVGAVVLTGACSSDVEAPEPAPASSIASSPVPSQSVRPSDSAEKLVVEDVAKADIVLDPENNEMPNIQITDKEIRYTVSGNDGCLPVLTDVTFESGIYTLKVKEYLDESTCTTDLTVFQQLITHADGKDIDDEAQIELIRSTSSESVDDELQEA